jgi:hypothetical protein
MKTTVTAAVAALLTLAFCDAAHAQDSYISCLLEGDPQPSILSIRGNDSIYLWVEEKERALPLCIAGERVVMDGTYTSCFIFDNMVSLTVYDLEDRKIGTTVINRMNGEALQYEAGGKLSGKGKCKATASPYVQRRKF